MQKKGSVGIIIVIITVILIVTVSIFGYFYAKKYKNSPLPEPEIPKITVYFRPIDYYTREPVEVNYKLLEWQIIHKCLEQGELPLFLRMQQEIQEINNLELQGKLNHTEAKSQIRGKEREFYGTYPYLFDKNLQADGCYVDKTIYNKISDGILTPNLNQFKINPYGIYFIYYWSDQYYFAKEVLASIGHINEINKENFTEEQKQYILDKNNSIFEFGSAKKADDIAIELWGKIEPNQINPIRFKMQSNNYLRHVHLCFEWTFGIVDINGEYPLSDKPSRLKADKCFRVNSDLARQHNFTQEYNFTIKTENLIPEDYFKIYVLDEDGYDRGDREVIAFEDSGGQDIGAKDFSKLFKLD